MLHMYVTRHGQNIDNEAGILTGHRDLPLTEIGRRQAYILAQKIRAARLRLDCIYSSPLCRALLTAQIVHKELNIPEFHVLPLLIERNFGEMTGRRIGDIERLCAPHILKTPNVTYFLNPPNGEQFPDTLKRACMILEYVRSRHVSGSVLFVTHGDIGKMLCAAHYGLAWMETLSLFHFGNCELVQLHPNKLFSDHALQIMKLKQYNS